MMFFMAGARLIPVKCPSGLRESSESRFSYQTTVEGRVKAQASPRLAMPRSWDIEVGLADSPAKSVIEDLVSGVWGNELRFIPADAPNVNVLTPDESMLAPLSYRTISQGGPVDLGSAGFAARSVISSDGAPFTLLLPGTPDTPVRPEHPVTGSAWVKGISGYILLQFLGSDGTLLHTANISSPLAGSDFEYRRVSVSGVAPSGARHVRLSGREVLGVTQPAITWTDRPLPFGHGRAAHKVTLSAGGSQVLHTAVARTYSSMSYTIQEVG